jgi:murein DD-endopeptidase MepM/ murein hydrolase activator NlpD
MVYARQKQKQSFSLSRLPWSYLLIKTVDSPTLRAHRASFNTPHELPQPVTLDNILGNHVILRIAPNLYVTYAHLQKGSIQVAPHQHVRCGTVIARLGNSGQATAPHLHLQVTDGNSGLEAEGVPFVFDQFTDFGPGATYEVNHHPSIPRKHSLPGKDEVIDFTSALQKRNGP